MKKNILFQYLIVLLLVVGSLLSSTQTANAQPAATVQVGTGTLTNSGTPMPYYTGWWGNKNQYLIKASELTALGAIAGDISGLGFEVLTAGGLPMTNFTVKIGLTTLTALTATYQTTPLTTVFTTTTLNPVANSVNMHPFTVPFYWDGTSNLIIETCFNNSSWSGGHTVRYSTTTFNASTYAYADNSTVCATTSGYTSTNRPNIYLNFIVPPNNTGITEITEPSNDEDFCSEQELEIKAKVHNFGSNIVNNVTVNWSVNGVLQAPLNVTDPIDMENTTAGPDRIVTLGSIVFPHNIPQEIRAWTSMPNGVQDTKTSNDSTSKTVTATLLGVVGLNLNPESTILCEGSYVTLDAGTYPANPIYIWSNAQLTQSINASTAGSYWVKVQNSYGCYATDTINLTYYDNPSINSIAVMDDGNENFTFNVIGAAHIDTYTWDFGDNTTQSGVGLPTAVSHVYAVPDIYDVTLTVSNQCKTISVVRKIQVFGTTSISDIEAMRAAFSVYPNPTSSTATIENKSNLSINQVTVVNVMGQTVYTYKDIGKKNVTINMSTLADGIYNIIIHTDKGNITKKLEVIK
jgi:hypothetical protein